MLVIAYNLALGRGLINDGISCLFAWHLTQTIVVGEIPIMYASE